MCVLLLRGGVRGTPLQGPPFLPLMHQHDHFTRNMLIPAAGSLDLLHAFVCVINVVHYTNPHLVPALQYLKKEQNHCTHSCTSLCTRLNLLPRHEPFLHTGRLLSPTTTTTTTSTSTLRADNIWSRFTVWRASTRASNAGTYCKESQLGAYVCVC